MIRSALLALLFSACVTDGTSVAEQCGPAPLAPGWAVQYDGDQASMSRADMERISAWRDDIGEYLTCAEAVSL